MTSQNRRIYEMLGRVQVFATANPHLFPKGTPSGRLLEEAGSATRKMADHQLSKMGGAMDGKTSVVERQRFREELLKQMDAVVRTARGLGFKQFWMSTDRSDRSLIERGQLFGDRLRPLSQQFVDGHLPPDFIDRLGAAVANLEATLDNGAKIASDRSKATEAIDHARSAALAALSKLDNLVENQLQDDPATLGAWKRARHVERYTAKPRHSEPDSATVKSAEKGADTHGAASAA